MESILLIEPDVALRTALWGRFATLDAAVAIVPTHEAIHSRIAAEAPPSLVVARGVGDAAYVDRLRRHCAAKLRLPNVRLVVLEWPGGTPRGRHAGAYLLEVDTTVAAALFGRPPSASPPASALADLHDVVETLGATRAETLHRARNRLSGDEEFVLEAPRASQGVREAYAALALQPPGAGCLRHECDGRAARLSARWPLVPRTNAAVA